VLRLLRPAQTGAEKIEINLRIARQQEITHALRFAKHAVVLRTTNQSVPPSATG